jgi:hypothetical protein
MANTARKIMWKGLTLAIGIPVGIAAKKGVDAVWRATTPADTPHGPADPRSRWQDALGWAVLSGVGVATAQLITSKGAATIWRGLVGGEPPGGKASRAASKRAAAA